MQPDLQLIRLPDSDSGSTIHDYRSAGQAGSWSERKFTDAQNWEKVERKKYKKNSLRSTRYPVTATCTVPTVLVILTFVSDFLHDLRFLDRLYGGCFMPETPSSWLQAAQYMYTGFLYNVPSVGAGNEVSAITCRYVYRWGSGRVWNGTFPDCWPLAKDSAAKLKRSQLYVCNLFPPVAEICARLAGNFC